MKLVTKKTDYAMRALIYLAEKRGTVPVSELVKSLGMPGPFLRSILQELEKRVVVKSFRGKGGGFELALPPEKIFLTELIEIFQGPIKLNDCMVKDQVCPDVNNCPLRNKIDDIQEYVVSELESITIGSLSH